MREGMIKVPPPHNEAVLSYAPASSERTKLVTELKRQQAEPKELPSWVYGKAIHTQNTQTIVMPHKHSHTIGQAHHLDAKGITTAIDAALDARNDWSLLPFTARAAVFLKAARLLEDKYRYKLNASTMLGQSKTCHQAEIDAACELIDFWRFNVHFAEQIYANQPLSSSGVWNQSDHRPLEGFVAAISPFNFTSIAANLCTAPALMGCAVVWKPASTQAHSAAVIMEILSEAGLPPGVINMVHADGPTFGETILSHTSLSGIHFTGSTQTFTRLWKGVANNLDGYQSFPRLVGETGGKDFVFAHPSADAETLAPALLRGAFEYQGQKCSAASRAYIPKSLWAGVKTYLHEQCARIKMGDVCDFQNFMGALIDEKSFDKTNATILAAKADSSCEIIVGGSNDKSEGYFIKPTLIVVNDPKHELMTTELFAPVLTLFIYDDNKLDETVALCANTSPYALTGGIFAQDRHAIEKLTFQLRDAAGNFYINDKPTGAVVGQQPFGGARKSGTNDKAGSPLNLMRWVSPRSIKENLSPSTVWDYPHMN